MIDTSVKSKKKKANETFQFEVLFLKQNFEIEKQADKVDQLMNFVAHPRMIATQKKSHFMKKEQSIYECLRQFRTPENLSESDSWYCSQCKEHREAKNQLELYKTAPVLIFSFNRFKQQNVYFSEKMSDKINFPIYGLDMSPFVLSGKTTPEEFTQEKNAALIANSAAAS